MSSRGKYRKMKKKIWRLLDQVNVLKLFSVVILLASFVTFTLYVLLDYRIGTHGFFSRILQSQIDDAKIRKLMLPKHKRDYIEVNPLDDLYLPDHNMMHFYDLPKRKSHIQFNEITSANRDNSYPLAPDFSVHIDYGDNHVTIYEDYGPGCVFRIYLFPVLPREVNNLHALTSKDLRNMFLHVNVDGVPFKYSLQAVIEGTEFPFLYPMSATHKRPASGLGAYVPICYRKHMRIKYIHDAKLPEHLLHVTVNCSANDLMCPAHIYSGVSRHKFPIGTNVNSFADIQKDPVKRRQYENILKNYAEALKYPELNGPMKTKQCELTCKRLCRGCTQEIFSSSSSGVIAGMRMRVYRTSYGYPVLSHDWNDLLFTANFDSMSSKPQMEKILLGWLFGFTGSANAHRGAAMGHMPQSCDFNVDADLDVKHNFSEEEMTGYFYFPMPFWKQASISITGSEATNKNTVVCYQVYRVDNHYTQESTGCLHANAQFYGSDVSGYRSILALNNTWGHVVATLTNIDNLWAARNVPLNERWALLQSDHVLYLDHRHEAAMMGTGLEDYFSYAHGFALAENTSYAYVGNYHAAPPRKEPLPWHVYRLHVLDPVPFNNHIHFIMEGTNRYSHFKPVHGLQYSEYRSRLKQQETTESHLTFYYAKSTETTHQYPDKYSVLDTLQLSDKKSEKEHQFEFSSSKLGSSFHKEKLKYLGQVTLNASYSASGRFFGAGDKIQFTLRFQKLISHKVIILRRVFFTAAFSWNQSAKIWINEIFYGHWFSPMGTLNELYSLREQDLVLEDLGVDSGGIIQDVLIEIETETDWNDIRYELIGWS